MTLAREQGIKVTERAVDKSELFIADEVFLTGTAARITPVNRIEGYSLKSERPVTSRLLTELVAATEGRSSKYENWITRCCISN
jgi:branched-chain amino acid aminotransferase